jgi:hypothetical protein
VKVSLPEPNHPMGFRASQLEVVMTEDQLADFLHWMRGQTCAVSDDGEAVFYPWDVDRWNEGRPIID